MARRVHQIERVGLAVLGRIGQAHRLSLDGNAALALDIHRIEDLFLHLAVGEPACGLDQPVGQGRFAVVDMGHDREIADMGEVGHEPRYVAACPGQVHPVSQRSMPMGRRQRLPAGARAQMEAIPRLSGYFCGICWGGFPGRRCSGQGSWAIGPISPKQPRWLPNRPAGSPSRRPGSDGRSAIAAPQPAITDPNIWNRPARRIRQAGIPADLRTERKDGSRTAIDGIPVSIDCGKKQRAAQRVPSPTHRLTRQCFVARRDTTMSYWGA